MVFVTGIMANTVLAMEVVILIKVVVLKIVEPRSAETGFVLQRKVAAHVRRTAEDVNISVVTNLAILKRMGKPASLVRQTAVRAAAISNAPALNMRPAAVVLRIAAPVQTRAPMDSVKAAKPAPAVLKTAGPASSAAMVVPVQPRAPMDTVKAVKPAAVVLKTAAPA